MELKILGTIFVVFYAEVSATMLNLTFVHSYMMKYSLNFPLFVLHPLDLDQLYSDMVNITFPTFSFYCYEEGDRTSNNYLIQGSLAMITYNFQKMIHKEWLNLSTTKMQTLIW